MNISKRFDAAIRTQMYAAAIDDALLLPFY